MPLEKIYEEVILENIQIRNLHFSNTKKAMCVQFKNVKIITLDYKNITSVVEEKEILAEELSHFQTGTLYMIKNNFNEKIEKQNQRKFEAKAKRHSTLKLVKQKDVEKLKYMTSYELATELCVSEKTILDALKIYKNRGRL